MTRETSFQLIARLRTDIDGVLAPLVPDTPFALVDFPDHPNVGDSAIWLGEMAFFRQKGRKPSYVSSTRNLDYGRLAGALGPSGTIFIHGGGNFGDIWPVHQALREAMLRDLAGYRIVQLPQTIQYGDSASIAGTASFIAAHGDFTLLVRDERSLALSKAHFPCAVKLCPDMAFCLGPVKRPVAPLPGTLALLRTDKEASAPISALLGCLSDVVRGDWLDEPKETRQTEKRGAALLSMADLSIFSPDKRRRRYYSRLAGNRVRRGMKLLSSRAYVISDRLHAHILCTLLDIPHTALDNNYGKISDYMATWRTDWQGVRKAESLAQALDQIRP